MADKIATVVDESDPKKPVIDFRRISQRQFLEWLFLNSLKPEDIDTIFPRVDGKYTIDNATVQLVVNGVAVDVMPTLRKMCEEKDNYIEGVAKKMFEEKVQDRIYEFYNIIEDVKSTLKEETRRLFPLASVFEEDD